VAMCCVCCVFAERSDLSFVATEGGEQAASGGETNNQEMHDKKKSSAHSANRGAHRDEAGGGGGARVREPSSHTLIQQGEELTLYLGPTPSKLAR
jgi:hypothetical protein